MQRVIDLPVALNADAFVSASPSAAIELRNVSKRFGDLIAVQDVNLTVPAGQVIALLGPNGAGKTTTISMMLGLRRPTTGSVSLLGAGPADLHARSRTGVMLQESGIPMQMRPSE